MSLCQTKAAGLDPTTDQPVPMQPDRDGGAGDVRSSVERRLGSGTRTVPSPFGRDTQVVTEPTRAAPD
jgi:hypothetical protein